MTVPPALLGRARLQAQAADGGDRGQGFAAEAQGGDGEQVFGVLQLAGGVALEGQQGIVAHHAAAVVDDLDELLAAGLDVDPDARGAGIQRVLQQLLDHRGGTLDDLTGGDLVGNVLGEYVNSSHGRVSVYRD